MARELEDWINGWIAYNDQTEPPYTYHLWVAISVISAVLQRKCRFEFGSLTYFPNIYAVLVGPSGKARKGTAMQPALVMLQDLGINLAAESVTREALVRELNDSKDQTADVDQGTMDFHCSLTIFSPELAVFLGYQNMQLISDLTDWYDCRNKWIYRTKHEGTDIIEGVYVTLLGATTPDLIKSSLPMDAIGGGLTSRIIYVFEETKGKVVPFPVVSERERQLWRCLERDLQQIHTLRGNFTFTQDFLDGWVEWYSAQEDNPPFKDKNFTGYIERRPNHIMKLSMILSASRADSMVVTAVDLNRAIGILELTERKMVQTFSGVGESSMSGVISNVMNEIGVRGEVSKEELMQVFYRDVSEWQMDNVLDTIRSMGGPFSERIDTNGKKYYTFNKPEGSKEPPDLS